MRGLTTKKQAEKQARKLRKRFPNRTVNVVRITRTTWGNRLSPKGKRDKFDWRSGKGNWRKGTRFRKRRR